MFRGWLAPASMNKRLLLAAVAAIALPFPSLAQTAPDVAKLRDAALKDDTAAWDIVEGLTT